MLEGCRVSDQERTAVVDFSTNSIQENALPLSVSGNFFCKQGSRPQIHDATNNGIVISSCEQERAFGPFRFHIRA